MKRKGGHSGLRIFVSLTDTETWFWALGGPKTCLKHKWWGFIHIPKQCLLCCFWLLLNVRGSPPSDQKQDKMTGRYLPSWGPVGGRIAQQALGKIRKGTVKGLSRLHLLASSDENVSSELGLTCPTVAQSSELFGYAIPLCQLLKISIWQPDVTVVLFS